MIFSHPDFVAKNISAWRYHWIHGLYPALPLPLSLTSGYLRDTKVLLAASALFGLLVWLALPAAVVTCDDDFSYLRSVVETIRRGRPWTDDWLNPWAASTSSLSALLYKLTGSFRLAIHFTLVLAASATFLGMGSFIRKHDFDWLTTLGITTLVLASPVVLFMSLMFTSVPVYNACLWFCLLLASQRKWTAFFIFWLVGVSSRQSAIVWLALPATACIDAMWHDRSLFPARAAFLKPLATGCAGLIAFLCLKAYMNPTTGQAVVIKTIHDGFVISDALTPLVAGILALAAGYGTSCLLGYLRMGKTHAGIEASHARRILKQAMVLAAAGLGALAGYWVQKTLSFTHWSQFMAYRDPLMILVGLLAGGGIALHPVLPRWQFLVPAAGVIVLLCLYSGTFDYYFTEVFCYGLAAGLLPLKKNPAREPVPAPPTGNAIPRIVLVTIVGLCVLRTFLCLKIQQDYALASIRAYETAIRKGILKPHQIGLTTFGYLGWNWEKYYNQTQGYKSTRDLANYRMWKEPWDGEHGTGLVVEYPRFLASSKWLKNMLPLKNPKSFKGKSGVVALEELHSPFLWVFDNKISIKRVDGKHPAARYLHVDYTKYHRDPFPLDDEEWRLFIGRQNLWAPISQRESPPS